MSSITGKPLERKQVTTQTLDFVKENVLSVTDLTRSNKLSEILNKYAGAENEEIFIIQNNKKKNSQAVLADLEYFEHLLKYKEIVDEAIDDYMFSVVLERKEEKADISLEEAFSETDFDYENLISQLEKEDED